jgi:hypothetical protein
MTRLVFWIALIALAQSLTGCQTQAPPPPATPAAPDAKIKAGELLQEYGANAVAADAKYKDKILQVSGKFGLAAKAPLLGYAVQLLPEDAGDVNTSTVQCFIVEAAQPDVVKMQAGDKITIQGKCDGQVLGQVKLSKCTVVK